MNLLLFFFILFIDSDIFPACLLSFVLYQVQTNSKKRNPWLLRVAFIFLAIAIHGVTELSANFFGYKIKPVPTTGFLLTYLFGRLPLTLSLWSLIFYMLRNQKEPTRLSRLYEYLCKKARILLGVINKYGFRK